jgi:hypothetical protein
MILGIARPTTARRQPLRLLLAVACVAVLCLGISTGTAFGSETIGQVAPTTPPVDCQGTSVDLTQPTVTSGTAYVVPSLPQAQSLVISSWSTNAATGPGQMLTMKVFRKVADPATFEVVGHSGPEAITPATLNTFKSNVPVEPGDILGIHSPNTPGVGTACSFSVPGETRFVRIGNLADGESGAFSANADDRRVNVSAVVSPSNSFKFGKVKRDKKRGTAKLQVDVPNPGDLGLVGKGVEKDDRTIIDPRTVNLIVEAKGKKERKLKRNGKVKVKLDVTFAPKGGDPRTRSKKLTLRKR